LFIEQSWKQSLDQGIFAVKRPRGRQVGLCFNQSAMQAKGATISEGVKQSINDEYLQAAAWDPTNRNPEGHATLIRFSADANAPFYQLIPAPDGQPATRYLYNTAGARIPPTDKANLTNAGLEVVEIQLPFSAKGLKEVSRAIVRTVLEILDYY
jgi:hypothetical protein